MPTAVINVEVPIEPTPRVLQLRGLFDLPDQDTSRVEWDVDLPLEEKDWRIGLIVGPSGAGKSTIARSFWPKELQVAQKWPKDKSVVDAFPATMGVKDVCDLMSSVGFSSPPAWLRPYHVLSTGEQFRVSIARTLAEKPDLAVVDEFTSVVDRTVAKIGSAAIAKTVRRREQKLIAVTCHEDVESWLAPDWVYRPAEREFTWGCLQRPSIEFDVTRVRNGVWPLFAPHHYLDAHLHKAAVSFGAFYDGRLVAFAGWLPLSGRVRHARRASRIVCLPDFQGVGIGMALLDSTAAMWRGLGERAMITSTHPAVIQSLNRSPHWTMKREPSRTPPDSDEGSYVHQTRSQGRNTAGFEYVGPALEGDEAKSLRA